MSADARPLTEVAEQGMSALLRELGVVDTLRFIQHLREGRGDYTEERRERFADVTLEEIFQELERSRAKDHAA